MAKTLFLHTTEWGKKGEGSNSSILTSLLLRCDVMHSLGFLLGSFWVALNKAYSCSQLRPLTRASPFLVAVVFIHRRFEKRDLAKEAVVLCLIPRTVVEGVRPTFNFSSNWLFKCDMQWQKFAEVALLISQRPDISIAASGFWNINLVLLFTSSLSVYMYVTYVCTGFVWFVWDFHSSRLKPDLNFIEIHSSEEKLENQLFMAINS